MEGAVFNYRPVLVLKHKLGLKLWSGKQIGHHWKKKSDRRKLRLTNVVIDELPSLT